MTKRILLAAAALAGCTIFTLPAMAVENDIGNNTLGVSLEVTAGCTVATSPIGFATSGKIVAAVNDTETTPGTITLTCTDGIDYEIGLNEGANAGTGQAAPSGVDTTTRRLFNTDATTYKYVAYDLYSNAGHTTHWGNDPTVDTVSGTGVGGAPVSVYGKLAASQNVEVGTYSDTVTATVWYDDGL